MLAVDYAFLAPHAIAHLAAAGVVAAEKNQAAEDTRVAHACNAEHAPPPRRPALLRRERHRGRSCHDRRAEGPGERREEREGEKKREI